MKYAIFCIFVIAALLAAGCDSKKTNEQPQQQANEPDQVEVKDEETPVTTSDDTREFLNFINKKSSLEWQITYDSSSTFNGQNTKSTMIQYIKKDKMRTDVSTSGIETRSYFLNNELISCSRQTAKWNCMKITDIPKDQMKDMEKELQASSENYNVIADGTKTIININTKCFKVDDKSGKAKARYCYTNEGVPIYVRFEAEGVTSEMIALLYEKVVKDSVFTLPAEPSEMPTMTMPEDGEGGENPCSACDYLNGEMKNQCLASC